MRPYCVGSGYPGRRAHSSFKAKMDWFIPRYESLGSTWHVFRRERMLRGEDIGIQPTAHRIRASVPERLAKPGDLVYYRRSFYEQFQERLGNDPAHYSQNRLAEGLYRVLGVRGDVENGWSYELERSEFVNTMWCRRWRGEHDAEVHD